MLFSSAVGVRIKTMIRFSVCFFSSYADAFIRRDNFRCLLKTHLFTLY